MKDISEGIVTFMFTDIEGSTILAEVFSESIHESLARHNSIIRETKFEKIKDMVNSFYCNLIYNNEQENG